MAVTKIIPIRSFIENSIDYICNPRKTDDLLYVHSEHCVPQTAALTFKHHLEQARAGGNTIGRHLIQSFAPGEVTPEAAHEIGKKLAGEILGGKYAYVMATHVDRDHLHNHFVWGAADVQTHKKYRSNKNTYHEIRAASDRLCEENDLSVIVPKNIGKSYAEYHAEKQGTSWKAKLKAAIDAILSESRDYDDFLKRMEAQGYEIKKGTQLSFRAPGQTRFTRAKTLGNDYAEDVLRGRASGKSGQSSFVKTSPMPLQKVIDIEGNDKIKSSPGYRQWVSVFNLKQTAASYNLIQAYGGLKAFDELYSQALSEKMALAKELNGMDAEIKGLQTLRNHLRAYGRTKDAWRAYQNETNPRRKEKYYEDHRGDIEIHRAAKKAIAQAAQPVPDTKTIAAEIERLQTAKIDVSHQYNASKAKLNEMEIVRSNIYRIIGQDKGNEKKRGTDLQK